MPYELNETHDPKLQSWVESANDPETDFPIQNLPWCVYVADDSLESAPAAGLGVRLGDVVVALEPLVEARLLDDVETDEISVFESSSVQEFLSLGHELHSMLRARLVALLCNNNTELRSNPRLCEAAILPIDQLAALPLGPVPNYTDFYASLHHATNVGSMFRPDNPILPNYKHIPIGYHGRASSIVPSGAPIRRPVGQQAPTEENGTPDFGPCKLLDYELELGVIVGQGNELGEPIPMDRVEDHLFGMCILNDWSARDMQKWEYQPLGPFLAKSFASTVSPYIVTMEALAPFRTPAFTRAAGDPQPLPYLESTYNHTHGGIDITVEAYLASADMRKRGMSPVQLSKGSFKDMYWTIGQMLAHHASNGCNMQPGDLLGSGTISGPKRENRGCLLELTWDGDPFAEPPILVPGTQRTPIKLPTGEERKFLADGDELIIKAYCEREGFRRIGFGECRGTIEPARS